MNRLRTSILSAAAALAGLTISTGAMAQATWNLYSGSGNGCSQNSTNSGNYGNTWNCTGSSGVVATASAWSVDRGAPLVGSYNTQAEIDYLSGSGYASAYLSPQGTSGFGASSRSEGTGASSPNHAFDSISPGKQDLLLLDFGSASVILDSIGIGWKGTDSDITVFQWLSSTAPQVLNANPGSQRTGDGHQNLTSMGWTLVGSYADLAKDDTVVVPDPTKPNVVVPTFGDTAVKTGATLASSWWLISTFDSANRGTCTACDAGNDAFKLNFVSTKPPTTTPPGKVPEPGSLALAGLALAGLFVVRRGSKKQG